MLVFYYLISLFWLSGAKTNENVYHLNPGDSYFFDSMKFSKTNRFHIFCYEGKPKNVVNVWQSVFLQIVHKTDDYSLYEGYNAQIVEKEYLEHRSSWSLNIFSWKAKHLKLDPFNQSCLGIESNDNYKVLLTVLRIDYWKILYLVYGVLLFVSASRLSQNVIFYYLCGILFGICASFLILIYFISKLFPKKPLMYGVVATGWTVGIYVLQLIWENLRTILQNYRIYLIWYTVGSAVISFIICYRWGPVKDEKTRNLIKWSLQLVGLISIFFSSHFQEAAVAQIVILLLLHNLPSSWLSKPKTYWKRRFPPKVKMLSNDEYYEQGVRETTKALEELRVFCSSPKCNQWKTALKLKDVKRFASFIEGNSHLSDEEVLEYETSFHQTDLTDDENLLTDED